MLRLRALPVPLSVATIRNLEMGYISRRSLVAIQQAVENAGLEFIEREGVRRRADEIKVLRQVDRERRCFRPTSFTLGGTGATTCSVFAPCYRHDAIKSPLHISTRPARHRFVGLFISRRNHGRPTRRHASAALHGAIAGRLLGRITQPYLQPDSFKRPAPYAHRQSHSYSNHFHQRI